MEITMIIVVVLAVLVGLTLGLLGGGGSILVVPLLTYIGGLDPKEAIATSLFVVGATSLVSLLGHARKGRVRWRTGLTFGAAGMAGAFLGGLVGGYIPGTVLMIAFAIMMIATAGAMISGRKDRDGTSQTHDHPLWRILLDGLVVGAATGLVGAGGGFLVVPALVLLAGLPMAAAVGTSLLVIAMKSFAGLGGYLTSVSLDWGLVAAVTAAAIAGSFVGVRLTSVVPEQALRRAFGYFVLVMGAFVLSQELPFPAAPIILGVVALTAVAAATCVWGLKDRCPLRANGGGGARPAGGRAPAMSPA